MAQYFISYTGHSPVDSDLAQRITESLESAGQSVFLDQKLSAGSDWSAEIEKAIDECDVFVVLLSEFSVTRDMVIAEIERAKQRYDFGESIVILPIRVRYGEELPYALKGNLRSFQECQWSDVTDTAGVVSEILAAANVGMPSRTKKRISTLRAADPVIEGIKHVRRYRSIITAMVSIGTIPPLLDLIGGIGSPWPHPTGCAYFTVLAVWATLVVTHALWQNTGQRALKTRIRWMFAFTVVALLGYAILFASFVAYGTDQNEEKVPIVTGFILQEGVPADKSANDLLAGFGFDPFDIWVHWTVVVSRISILSLWVCLFGFLSALTSAYILLLEVKERSR